MSVQEWDELVEKLKVALDVHHEPSLVDTVAEGMCICCRNSSTEIRRVNVPWQASMVSMCQLCIDLLKAFCEA